MANRYQSLKRQLIGKVYRIIISLRINRLIFGFNYALNIWGNNESRSGEGSTLEYTENLRQQLPVLIKKLRVRSVLDIPCGDLVWMSKLLANKDLNIAYTGVDIGGKLIKKNIKNFSSNRVKFERANALNYKYPGYDLVISRDFLFHLSFKDMNKFIENFLLSDSKFLLTSSYIDAKQNLDIMNGDFREINIFKAPYHFPNSTISIKDFVPPYPERHLFLFSREDVKAAYGLQIERGVQN